MVRGGRPQGGLRLPAEKDLLYPACSEPFPRVKPKPLGMIASIDELEINEFIVAIEARGARILSSLGKFASRGV